MINWLINKWLVDWRLSTSHNKYKDYKSIYSVMEKVNSLTEIKNLANAVYNKFTYTADKNFPLDEMRSPLIVYDEYMKGVLKDDCDGFHTNMYHILQANNIETLIITLMPKFNFSSIQDIGKGHTITAFKIKDLYYIIDYNSICYSDINLDVLIKNYWSSFKRQQNIKSDKHFIIKNKFNYDTNRFINICI